MEDQLENRRSLKQYCKSLGIKITNCIRLECNDIARTFYSDRTLCHKFAYNLINFSIRSITIRFDKLLSS